MVQHIVWKAGTGTEVISLKAFLRDYLDIRKGDIIEIDWQKGIKKGIIRIRRKKDGRLNTIMEQAK